MTIQLQKQLDQVAAEFEAHLPERLEAIRWQAGLLQPELWHRDAARRLYGLLHSLSGTAATLGQGALGGQAQRLAEQLEPWIDRSPAPAEWHAYVSALACLMPAPRAWTADDADAPVASARRGGARIDVVDDDCDFGDTVRAVLEERGYEVRCFVDLEQFQAACCATDLPDLVLLDLNFPAGEIAGAEVLALLRQERQSIAPVVCISRHDDMRSRLAAFRAGIDHYLVKPVDLDRLGLLVDELTQRDAAPIRVLLADNDRYSLHAHQLTLQNAGFEVTVTTEPLQVLDLVRSFEPDVVVLDVYMPDASGPEIAAVLRADEALSWLPVVFLSAERDVSKHMSALALGGDQFLAKPVRPTDLQMTVRTRALRARRLKALLQRRGSIPSSTAP